MRIPLSLPVAVAFASVFAVLASTHAEDAAPPKLEKHPLTDAKAGEWRRVKRTVRDQSRWYVERVIGVKAEGQVFFDVLEVSEDGKQRKSVAQAGRWFSVPKFQAGPGQEYKTDEMVWVDVGTKKVAARHLKIVEPTEPPTAGRKRTRDVWYSNEVLGSGKVKEQIDEPPTTLTTLDSGTMTPEDLKSARAEYRLDAPPQQPGTPYPAPGPAPSPPSGGGTGACGAACGGK